jgi:hypothetical protein
MVWADAACVPMPKAMASAHNAARPFLARGFDVKPASEVL